MRQAGLPTRTHAQVGRHHGVYIWKVKLQYPGDDAKITERDVDFSGKRISVHPGSCVLLATEFRGHFFGKVRDAILLSSTPLSGGRRVRGPFTPQVIPPHIGAWPLEPRRRRLAAFAIPNARCTSAMEFPSMLMWGGDWPGP